MVRRSVISYPCQPIFRLVSLWTHSLCVSFSATDYYRDSYVCSYEELTQVAFIHNTDLYSRNCDTPRLDFLAYHLLRIYKPDTTEHELLLLRHTHKSLLFWLYNFPSLYTIYFSLYTYFRQSRSVASASTAHFFLVSETSTPSISTIASSEIFSNSFTPGNSGF